MIGELLNLSKENVRYSEIKEFKKIVTLPDYSPNYGLPVGCTAVFDATKHNINPEYLGNDIGCGMMLAKFREPITDLEDSTNKLASALISGVANFGGGNHFITIYQVDESKLKELPAGSYAVLIHSGRRKTGAKSIKESMCLEKYLEEQNKIFAYAYDNRKKLLELVEDSYNSKTMSIIDRIHNSIERNGNEIVYRKGSVKLNPGEISVIPSSMGGLAAVVRANDKINEICYSLPHATGRRLSRGDAKNQEFFLDGFPNGVYVPYFIYAEDLNEELPPNYKGLDEVLQGIEKYASIEAKLSPRAVIMK